MDTIKECTLERMAKGPDGRDTGKLVGEAAEGDALAIDELLDRYLPSVRAYLRLRAGRLLLDRESVSDLAQSVCRVVLQNIGRFQYDHEDGFRRWLFATAERKILDRHDYYTAQKRAPEAERNREAVSTLSAYSSLHSPSRAAIATEELAELEQAMAQLPEEMREVLILAKIVGLSRAAIAEELGKGEGAVRMTLHRALARLADLMASTGTRTGGGD